MSKRKSEEQIIALLKRAEAGEPIADLCRQEGIGVSTFYKWRSKYDGLEASELKRLKQIEQEHERLKKMYAELSLMSRMQEEIIKKLYQIKLAGFKLAKLSMTTILCGKGAAFSSFFPLINAKIRFAASMPILCAGS